jgi:hypothetical protein
VLFQHAALSRASAGHDQLARRRQGIPAVVLVKIEQVDHSENDSKLQALACHFGLLEHWQLKASIEVAAGCVGS